MIAFLNRYGLIILCFFVLVYIAMYGYTSYRKYDSFSYYDFDLAIYNQVTWNTLHGSFLYSTIRENLYNMDGVERRVGTYFKDHVPLILLFMLPVYVVFQTPLTLLMLQTAFLGAAAVPLYLIARRELHGGWGLVLGLVYLLFPALGYLNLFEFHPLCFAPFFFFFAFYWYLTGRFWPSMIFLVLALFCKEEVSITVFMFGVYVLVGSAIRKKVGASRKWIITPAVVGLVWAVLCFKVLSPMFNEGDYIYTSHFREMGGSMGGIIKTALTDPVFTIKHIFKIQGPMINKPLFLVQLFLPVMFLSFLSPLTLLIIIPQSFLYLASSKAATSTIYFQYTGAVIPFVFISAVMGARFLDRKIRWGRCRLVPVGVVLITGIICSLIWGTQFRLFSKNWDFIAANTTGSYNRIYISDYRDEIRDSMIESIPADASVAATFRFLDKLSCRRYIYSMHYIYNGTELDAQVKYTVPEKIDYALLDYSEGIFGFYETAESYKHMGDFFIGRGYGVEKVIDSFVLFKEGKQDLTPLYEVLDEQPEPENTLTRGIPVRLGNGEPFIFIGLIGTDIELIETDGFDQVEITSYWQCVNPAPRSGGAPAPMEMYVNILLVDDSDKEKPNVAAQRSYPICYEIYPAKLWKKDEFVKAKHYIALPPDITPGKYKVVLQPYPKNPVLQKALQYQAFI